MIWLKILIFFAAFFGMEAMAWWSHKYIMHGLLWSWHKSHHDTREGVLEKNDLFAVVFSVPALACIFIGGAYFNLWYVEWIGYGITGYGVFYFIFHDIIVHRRIKINYIAKSKYMKRLIRAHKIHHKHLGKHGAEAFGFLYAPKKYQV